MNSNLSRFKCAECGIRKEIINSTEYVYKIGSKMYCSYACYMKAYRIKYAKRIARTEALLQKINKIKDKELSY